ncbi:MAG: hypothetical protein WA990_14915 [Rubrobacteraceae bacterium]
MNLTAEYIHNRTGYRFGTQCCWVRIYRGESGDAPVVVCEELPGSGTLTSDVSGFLAAEVIRDHFPDGLPDLSHPLLWIEHRPPRRRGPGRYSLVGFASYLPRPAGAGFVRRETLGETIFREPLLPEEVAALTGDKR